MKVDQPEYEDLTPEQHEEYYQFSAALVTWLNDNPEVRVAWGWTPVSKFLLVIGVGNNNRSFYVARDIAQEDLWLFLDDAREILSGTKSAPKDEWDW